MPTAHVQRFGPFELDVRSGEIRKHGVRLRLPEQSFQLLLMLLESPGEIVTRADIRLRLWPNDTVVDFDKSITATMRRLRTALGDSAETPRYIETIAKRGYRFIGEMAPTREPDRPGKATPAVHYRLLEKLGEGGMGVVYRAEDDRLGRHVAVKLLPFAGGKAPAAALRRFEQEARAASALNHPNICTIHGLEEIDGRPGIVMELLAGETLAERLNRGPVQLSEALAIATQVTSALAEAHAAGVVHRDLKPGNIMLTKNGAKVLDFGLAQMTDAGTAEPAVNQGLPKSGIPGTVYYMSPEQMQGNVVDARSDIFSLGLVLYEMLSGRRAFESVSAADLKNAILKCEPAKLHHVPAAVQGFIERCLAKDPDARWESARAALIELERLALIGPPPPARVSSRRLWLLASAPLLLVLGVASAYVWRGNNPPLPPMRTVPLTTFTGLATYPSFAPDGERVVFTWSGADGKSEWGLSTYIKPVGNGDPVRVSAGPDDRLPKWSPDGTQIAFQRATKMDHELIVVPVGGGPERKIADMGIGLSWSPDGKEIAYVAPYAPNGSGALMVQNLRTGRVRQLTNPKPKAEGLVAWSPDGKLIAFARTLAIGSYDLFVVPSIGGEARRLTFDKTITDGFAWTADSRELVFSSYRSGVAALWRVRAAGGAPEPLGVSAPGPAQPAISTRGNRLAFHSSFTDSNIWQYERSSTGTVSNPAVFESSRCVICATVPEREPRYSPDGRKIVFTSETSGVAEIWVADSDGSYPIQLTTAGDPLTGSARWSPDGRWIAYAGRVGDNCEIFIISAQGGKPRQLTMAASTETAPSWSHDGRWVYFGSDRGGRESRIWKAPFGGGEAVQVTKGVASMPMESPDGKRLYFYNRDGRFASMPVEGGPEEAIPELANVHRTPAWTVSNDGIYFYQPKERQPIVFFFSFATRKLTPVLKPAKGALTTAPGLDVSPDGRKLLFTQVDQATSGMLLVENFR